MDKAAKSCPFCGSVSDLRTRGDDKVVAMCCDNCGAHGPNEYDSRFSWDERDTQELIQAYVTGATDMQKRAAEAMRYWQAFTKCAKERISDEMADEILAMQPVVLIDEAGKASKCKGHFGYCEERGSCTMPSCPNWSMQDPTQTEGRGDAS